MQYWKAHFKDALHNTELQILNTEADYCSSPLSFTLDGVTFCGSSPGDFQLMDKAQAEEACRKFCLLKYGGYNAGYYRSGLPYSYDLQRYELEVEIPVPVLRKRDRQVVPGTIFLAFRYTEPDLTKRHSLLFCDDTRVYRDDLTVEEISLSVDGVRFQSAEKDLYFEEALIDFSKQIGENY